MCVRACVQMCLTRRAQLKEDMFYEQLLSNLLVCALIFLPDTGSGDVVRAFGGETANLPCNLPHDKSQQSNIEWKNNSASICQYKYNNKTSPGSCMPRFTFNSENFSLNIENVQMSDSGNYSCIKTIIIPPPTIDFFKYVTLHVEDLSLERLKSSNSSCIHLLCSWESENPEPVNFTWFRKGHDSLLSSSVGNNSELYLCQPAWEENDTFTCQVRINKTLYNRSIELNPSTEPGGGPAIQNMWLLIIACSAAAGVIASLIFTAIICKCRKRGDSSGSFIFTNKVYENFSFAMARQASPPTATPQTEECIYEN